jgi:hypothetical protein
MSGAPCAGGAQAFHACGSCAAFRNVLFGKKVRNPNHKMDHK